METCVCLDWAYKKIRDSEIVQRILDKEKEIEECIMGYDFNDSFFDEAENSVINGVIEDSSVRDIFYLDFELDNSWVDYKNCFLKYPSYLARFILGDDVEKFEEYGFPCKRSLEEAVSCFAINKEFKGQIYEDVFNWRNRGFKNEFFMNNHGDLHVSQIESSEKTEKNLFGIELRRAYKIDPLGKGIANYQDCSSFLISLLKYADKIGKRDIREIVDWRGVLEEVGGVGNDSAEAFGGSNTWGIEYDMEYELAELGNEFKENEKYFKIPSGNYYRETISCFDNGKLVFLSSDEGGDIEFNGKIYSRRIEYDKNDLPDALKGTYRLFCRDRSLIPVIMNEFLEGDGRK